MTVADALRSALRPHLSAISIDSLVQRHLPSPTTPVLGIPVPERRELLERLATSVSLFSRNSPASIRADVRQALALDDDPPATSSRGESVHVPIRTEVDVSVARNEARRITVDAGGSATMSVKVATAVSELARNIVLYASSGSIDLEANRADATPVVTIVAKDGGPGIPADKLDAMFAGTYRSKTGLGKGLAAVKRIASSFEIDTAASRGTTVLVTFRGNG